MDICSKNKTDQKDNQPEYQKEPKKRKEKKRKKHAKSLIIKKVESMLDTYSV